MAFHLVVFAQAYDLDMSSYASGSWLSLPAIEDPMVNIVNGRYRPRKQAPLLGGVAWGAIVTSTPAKVTGMLDARVHSATLRALSAMHFVHAWDAQADVGLTLELEGGPIMLGADEEVTSDGSFFVNGPTSPTLRAAFAALLVGEGAVSAADRSSSFWIRATAGSVTKPSVTGDLPEWTPVGVQYEDQLPAGTYAVIGMSIASNYVAVARLVFEGQAERPGVPNWGSFAWRAGVNGTMGVWGRFRATAPPRVEILWADGAALPTDVAPYLVVRLRVARVGA